jgi:hypothetical protein
VPATVLWPDGGAAVRQLKPDRSKLIKAGCVFAFAVFWTGISLTWVGAAWSFGAPWFFTIIGVPFVLFGFGMLGWSIWTGLIRTVTVGRYFGPPEIVISDEQLRVGQAFTLRYRQPVRREIQLRRVVIQTILRETAIYRRGTDTYTVTHDRVIEEHVSEGRRLYANDEVTEERRMRIPPDAMHSFDDHHNKLTWYVRVNVDLPTLPDVWEETIFSVEPELAAEGG